MSLMKYDEQYNKGPKKGQIFGFGAILEYLLGGLGTSWQDHTDSSSTADSDSEDSETDTEICRIERSSILKKNKNEDIDMFE